MSALKHHSKNGRLYYWLIVSMIERGMLDLARREYSSALRIFEPQSRKKLKNDKFTLTVIETDIKRCIFRIKEKAGSGMNGITLTQLKRELQKGKTLAEILNAEYIHQATDKSGIYYLNPYANGEEIAYISRQGFHTDKEHKKE